MCKWNNSTQDLHRFDMKNLQHLETFKWKKTWGNEGKVVESEPEQSSCKFKFPYILHLFNLKIPNLIFNSLKELRRRQGVYWSYLPRKLGWRLHCHHCWHLPCCHHPWIRVSLLQEEGSIQVGVCCGQNLRSWWICQEWFLIEPIISLIHIHIVHFINRMKYYSWHLHK